MWRVIPGLRRLIDRGAVQTETEQQASAEPSPPQPPAADEVQMAPALPVASGPRKRRGTTVSPEIPKPPASPRQKESASSPATGAAPGAFNIYNQHFGLTARPFALVPDPDFLFWSPAHKRAYSMLEYGVLTHSPITLITGEVGAGKTTLLHQLLRSLPSSVRVGLISNPSGSRAELLRWVLMALDQPAAPDETYVDLFSRFQAHLIEEYGQGRRVVLIFDEAQNLGREALEELRMFTNINSGKDELLQLVLVGQPELRDIVGRSDMRQFAQRVASNFHLPAMDLPTVRAYIAHRLKVAGRNGGIFSPAAIELVHAATGGVPRVVNQLCDLALLYAFTKGSPAVNRRMVQQVLDDGALFAVDALVSKGDK
jgi:general secretion pathway protein A